MKIYNIRQLNLSTITDISVSGVSGSVQLAPPYEQDISAYSTLSTVDLSGVSTLYEIAKPISIKDIMSSNLLLEYQEKNYKNILHSLDYSLLQTNLYTWGAKGFPDLYVVYEYNLNISDYKCSDGVIRSASEYVDFILGTPIKVLVDSYQATLKDIEINYSIQESPLVISFLSSKSTTGVDYSGGTSVSTIESALQELSTIEKRNNSVLQNIDYDILEKNLYIWGSTGYPNSYLLYECVLSDPVTIGGKYRCSDGLLRDVWDYITFVLGSSVQTLLDKHQLQLEGIVLGFSIKINPITVGIHASSS